MKLVFLAPAVASGEGDNRSLLAALTRREHDILLLQPDERAARDGDGADPCRRELYRELAGLDRWRSELVDADAVIVCSDLRQGAAVGDYVQRRAGGIVAFWDSDTPATLARLERGAFDSLSPDLIPGYDVYLASSGGPDLERLEQQYGSPAARTFPLRTDSAPGTVLGRAPASRAVDLEACLFDAGATAALALASAGCAD